jgi:hypothetical protein
MNECRQDWINHLDRGLTKEHQHQQRFCSRTQNKNETEKGVGTNGMSMLRRNRITNVMRKIKRMKKKVKIVERGLRSRA